MVERNGKGNDDMSPLHRALRLAALRAALQDDRDAGRPQAVLVACAGAWSFADEDEIQTVSGRTRRAARCPVDAAPDPT